MQFSSVLSFRTIPFVAIPKLRIRDSMLATFALFFLLYLFTLFKDHSVKNLLPIDFSSQVSSLVTNSISVVMLLCSLIEYTINYSCRKF